MKKLFLIMILVILSSLSGCQKPPFRDVGGENYKDLKSIIDNNYDGINLISFDYFSDRIDIYYECDPKPTRITTDQVFLDSYDYLVDHMDSIIEANDLDEDEVVVHVIFAYSNTTKDNIRYYSTWGESWFYDDIWGGDNAVEINPEDLRPKQ